MHAIVDTLGYYAAPADLIPPPVPKLQRVTASNASATVLWNRVAASDLSGYTVYSAKSSQGPWNPVRGQTALTLDRSLAGLVVSGLTNGTTYWFAVAAYDNAGNTSAKSTPLSATPIAPPPDTTPRTPQPDSSSPVDGAASADLSWNPVSAPDLADYVVYRNNQVAAQTTGTGTRLGVIVGRCDCLRGRCQGQGGQYQCKVPAGVHPNYEYCIYDLTIQEAKSGTHPGGANGFTPCGRAGQLRSERRPQRWGNRTLAVPRLQVGRNDPALRDRHSCAFRRKGSRPRLDGCLGGCKQGRRSSHIPGIQHRPGSNTRGRDGRDVSV